MLWIGHSEFGLDYQPIFNHNIIYRDREQLNHWIEQWLLCYGQLKIYRKISNVKFVCYEDLCEKDSIFKLILKFQMDRFFNFKINKRNKSDI